MGRTPVLHFHVIPRGKRAEHLVPTIRRCSKKFKEGYAANDQEKMESASKRAWEAMANLFEILRNEQDQGRLADTFMTRQTGTIANNLTNLEQTYMILNRKIDRHHNGFCLMNLRDALNKIAHHDTALSTFRIDGRGSHYIILGGQFRRAHWIAEVLVSTLCTNAAAAVRAIH